MAETGHERDRADTCANGCEAGKCVRVNPTNTFLCQGRQIVGKGVWLLLESGEGERFLECAVQRHVMVLII